MSNFVDLDSYFRDRVLYPNPCNYQVTPEQVKTWFFNARTVRASTQNPVMRPLNFVSTVNLHVLTLPYDDRLMSLPRLYVDFHSVRYNDRHLISTIDGVNPEARFICLLDRVQYDATNAPIWIHYRCFMQQTLRIDMGGLVQFTITTRDGNILDIFIDQNSDQSPDPKKQVIVTFEVTPYLRDADYTGPVEPIDNF